MSLLDMKASESELKTKRTSPPDIPVKQQTLWSYFMRKYLTNHWSDLHGVFSVEFRIETRVEYLLLILTPQPQIYDIKCVWQPIPEISAWKYVHRVWGLTVGMVLLFGCQFYMKLPVWSLNPLICISFHTLYNVQA